MADYLFKYQLLAYNLKG